MPISLMRGNNAQNYIDFLCKTKVPFNMISSNYTTQIKGEGIDQKFVANFQSKRTFAAFSKIKASVKDKPVPEVGRESVTYFHHDFKKDAYFPRVFNIDLKSAYAYILYKDGFLTEDCYNYIKKCKKQERLTAVGMLASKKNIFEFVDGAPVTFDQTFSETSGFFFYAVKRTYEIMSELKKICGDNYLFTWVDGIYFVPDNDVLQNCIDYLEEIGFLFSVDDLTDFNVLVMRRRINVTFLKPDSKGKPKKKNFNLPMNTTDFQKITLQAILLLNSKKPKNETSKI